MSEETTETEPRPAPASDPASDAALARYNKRMRPWRIGYAAAIAAVLVAAVVIVVVAYQHGEISHVSLHTVPTAPPSVAIESPATALGEAWSSSDTTAIGTPYYRGTIITHDTHTVRGRDAGTGQQTWAYTRTDRTVCAALQDSGLTLAVYRLHGNCDEVTALNSGTGQRVWTRTLDKDTAVFDGPASFAVLPGNFFFVSRTSIYAIAASGLDYWTFHHVGCTIHSAVLGVAGALISQTCVGEQCNRAKFCGNGQQLLLRDQTKGYDNDTTTNKNNPDQIIWNDFGSDLVPTLAGNSVGAREPDGAALQLLDRASGKPGARLALSGDSGSAAPSAVSSTTDADVIWIGGRSYALETTHTSFTWQQDTLSQPTVSQPPNTQGMLSTALLSVPTADGIGFLDPATGKQNAGYAVGPQPAGSLAYRFGAGFVIAGQQTRLYR
jgi:hypothetical protein